MLLQTKLFVLQRRALGSQLLVSLKGKLCLLTSCFVVRDIMCNGWMAGRASECGFQPSSVCLIMETLRWKNLK